MRNDQIFVLLLVVLLPLSGCFENTVGDAEGADDESGTTVVNNYYNQTLNSQPLFHVASVGLEAKCDNYFGGDCGRVSTYDPNTGEELSRMYHVTPVFWFSVTDPDSNITSVGIDLDLDQVMDFQFPNNSNWSDLMFYRGPDIAQSEGSLGSYAQYGSTPSMCFMRFNLMALDDNGGVGIVPYTLLAEGSNVLPRDAEGCQADYTGVEE